jgi:hypothetical protein
MESEEEDGYECINDVDEEKEVQEGRKEWRQQRFADE